uniref:hypothetical protein n=1 Tax=uncultured Mucilaginibacter sp. TaxID=797541 RepID=UPI0025D0C8D9
NLFWLMAVKKIIPFNFVFEYLEPLPYVVKPFFGCHGVYVGNKIVLILRERADHTDVNGVWIATTHEHHASLKKIFPSMRAVSVLNDGAGETAWQMIPADANDFESSVLELCQLIRRKDERIGRVPKKRK